MPKVVANDKDAKADEAWDNETREGKSKLKVK